MPVYKCRTLISTPQDLLRVTGRVPRLSSVYSRVKLLASRSEVSLKKIEREIQRDPAICARLPRLARIMYPALDTGASTVTEVLSILGGERIRHLLLVTAVAAAYRKIKTPHIDMRRFWRLAARRALLARLIALEAPHVDPTRAFVAGLLADVGHLLLHLGIPVPALDAQMRAQQCGMPVNEVETALLGFDYAQVGAVLVRRWRHCSKIENAIEFHTRPLIASEARGDACTLHVASRLAEAIEDGADLRRASGAIRAGVWHLVGHSYEQLPEIIARADEEFAALVDVLLPQPLAGETQAATPVKGEAVPITKARARSLLHFPAANMAPALTRKTG